MNKIRFLRIKSHLKNIWLELTDKEYSDKKIREKRVSEIVNELMFFPVPIRMEMLKNINKALISKSSDTLDEEIKNAEITIHLENDKLSVLKQQKQILLE